MSVKTTTASLRVFTQDTPLDFISHALGVSPTRAFIKGEPRNQRNPTSAKLEQSTWIYSSPLPDNSELESHIDHLLKLLEGRAKEIAAVRDRFEDMDIICMYSSDNGQGSAMLNANLLKRLARQNIDLVLDLYPPN